jgi:N-sulfoglucosamine sulfohydrolase
MKRIITSILAILTGGAITAAARPNILLITADDLGLQLSCYGDRVIQTPHLDELAARSVRFTTAYVSQASCSPSRSTMFTGLYPHGNGQYGLANANVGFRVHEELIDRLLPNVLKRAGYRTGIIGKLHVNPEKSFQFDTRHGEGFGTRDVRLQVKLAREFIGAAQDTPWFLMFNVFDPHVARKTAKGKGRGPQYFPDQVKGLPEKVLTAGDVPPWPWQGIDSPAQRTKIAGYYNCVQRIDATMGMLMQVLEEAGHADDTLIILLGDHGPPFTRGKTSCYEAGLRVPFIARWPGVSEPHVSDRLVGSIDIYPTLLDAAGVRLPEGLHGRSLRPVLRAAKNPDWRETLVGEFHFHGATPFFPRRAITDGRYKLIHNLLAGSTAASSAVDGDSAWQQARALPGSDPARQAMDRLAEPPEWELYDLRKDPVEFHNRAGDTGLKDVEAHLKASLVDWQRQTGDPFGDPEFRRQVVEKHQPKGR